MIFITSVLFLENQKDDYQHNKEAYELSFIVAEKTKSINQYATESGYLPIVGLMEVEDFPILRNEFNDNGKITRCLQPRECTVLLNIGELSLNEFLTGGKEKGLTHLVIDNSEHFLYRSKIIKDIFDNEENYPYLIKQFDSKSKTFAYQMKIFEIDFEKFEELDPEKKASQ